MSEVTHRRNSDRAFFLLLLPLTGLSLPSLLFCLTSAALQIHGMLTPGTVEFHLPAQNRWDSVFALQASICGWLSHWNSIATLAATVLFACTLVQTRWRHWAALALLPYGLLLCADFTLRWRYTLLP